MVVYTARGDALIAIGDVSEKGMPAAMAVSLIVGTISHFGTLHAKPLGNPDRNESTYASPQQGWVYHVLGLEDRT